MDPGAGERRHVHIEELRLRHGLCWRLTQRPAHLRVLILPLIPADTCDTSPQTHCQHVTQSDTNQSIGAACAKTEVYEELKDQSSHMNEHRHI